jgi:hypothetical protein
MISRRMRAACPGPPAAGLIRAGLGAQGRAVPARRVPDLVVRLAARFADPSLRAIVPALGRRNRHSTAKASRLFGWQPRPARQTVLDCARSLLDQQDRQGSAATATVLVSVGSG